MFNTVGVSWDGMVSVCCADANFDLLIGDVHDGLKNIFNSNRMWELRQKHLRGDFDNVCKQCMDPIAYHNQIPQSKMRELYL